MKKVFILSLAVVLLAAVVVSAGSISTGTGGAVNVDNPVYLSSDSFGGGVTMNVDKAVKVEVLPVHVEPVTPLSLEIEPLKIRPLQLVHADKLDMKKFRMKPIRVTG